MFYDVDILNRRVGKFGVIWLAANGKLRLKGKGSRNDFRLVEGVRDLESTGSGKQIFFKY